MGRGTGQLHAHTGRKVMAEWREKSRNGDKKENGLQYEVEEEREVL